jgi:hypothetical protein
MGEQNLYKYLAQIFGLRRGHVPSITLQTATVVGLAAFLACLCPSRALAQATGRVDVRATVVDVTASRSAIASVRWLVGQKRDVRKERGLATIEVSREKRQVAINYLKN